MITARSGHEFTAELVEAPTGLLGQLLVGIYSPAEDAFVYGPSADGVTEPGGVSLGIYVVTLIAPVVDVETYCFVLWTEGSNQAFESLLVQPSYQQAEPSATTGVLLNNVAGTVELRDGTVLAHVSARYWRTGTRPSNVGQSYDYKAIVGSEAAAAVVGHQNRTLVLENGERFQIVNATLWPTLNYVEMEMRQVKPNG